MSSPINPNPTAAELEQAQLVADLLGGGTAHPTVDGGLTIDPLGPTGPQANPTPEHLLACEIAAYIEHGERAAENGWRIMVGERRTSDESQTGWELTVPDRTPVILANGVLAWSTGQVYDGRFLVTLGTIFGPTTLVPGVRPCTEDNLPTRYAAALAVQLTDALDQIVDNDDDDDVSLRAIRMKRAAADIADGIITGTY